MLAHKLKRCLSFMLALVMIFSVMPVQAFAEETGHDHGSVVEGDAQVIDETLDPVVPTVVPTAEPAEVVAEGNGEGDKGDHEHSYTEETVAANCTEAGYTKYSCQCGESYTEEIAALGHKYESAVVEATETEKAYTEYTCSVCGDSYTEEIEEEPKEEEPSDLAVDFVTRTNAVIETYGLVAGMSDDEIKQAINAQPWSVNKPTLTEVEELWNMGVELPESDKDYVLGNTDVETFVRFREIIKPMFPVMRASSGNYTPVTGVTVSVSGATNTTNSSGTITTTAKGSGGIFGYGASTKTATIKVSNNSGSKAKISFAWTSTNAHNLTIDGTKYSGSTSGSFEKVMDAGTQITITLTTDKNSTENKLVMKNFAVSDVKESSKVEFVFDSGSVTVAGNAVANSDEVEIPMAGAELKATAKNGAAFLAWIDAESHVILSKAASFKLEPANDMTVKAVFTTNACFLVDGTCLYEDLKEAITAASKVSNKTIVLMNNGTLPAGDYTIPSGITLLIPYDDANTLCTTVPTTTDAKYSAVKVYRTMTMAEGAKITVNGAISLSATQTSSGGLSCPTGNTSFIKMEEGSNITVNNGGKLYAWGYIQGSGSVTVENGGTVYECFQVMDWRGGDNTSGMVGNSNRVFPMSQYYIQNVEVPLTLKAGAIENGYMSVSITLVGIQGSEVPFIGPNGMFNITNGSITKDYNEETGRLVIDMDGSVSVKSLSLSMKLGLLGSKTINSKDYVLPINGNMDITMHSGSVTMNQDIALLPGARLIIDSGASCTLANGNKIYVYDYDEWVTRKDTDQTTGEGPSFCGTPDATHINPQYASAKDIAGRDQDAYVEVNGVADLAAGYVYTTASGANIRGNGIIAMKPGTEKETYQVKHLKESGGDEKKEQWFKIPITSAVLQNSDGTQTITANDKGKVTYESVNGVWTCSHPYTAGTYVESTKYATCENPGVKTITCNCGEDSDTEEIMELGHKVVTDAAVAPTCTETGLSEGKRCEREGCGKIIKAQEPVPATGHDEKDIAAVAPTCTETGLTAGKECTVCGTVTVEQTVVAATGHDEKDIAAVAPTCTETGLTVGKECTVCGTVTVAQTVVAASGHTEEDVAAVAPTCTKTGLTVGKKCTVCGTVTVAQTVVAASGHTWGWVTDKEATVLEPGVKHEECSVCHAKQNENTEIPKLTCAHTGTITGTAAVAVSCTEAGNSAYWYCSACRNYYSDAAGQHEIKKDSWVIKALGHDPVAHAAQAPTCTEIGWEAYETCSRCEYSTYVELPAKGHGVLVEVAAVAATCQKEGNIAHWNCHDCGKKFADKNAVVEYANVVTGIDAYNHSFAEDGETTAANCTETGKIVYPCVNEGCKETKVETLQIDPENHVWDEGENFGNHSCNTTTYIIYTCEKCQLENWVVDRLQHFRVPIAEEIHATCTEDGMTAGEKCEQCDEYYVPQEVIPALGHDWGENYPCQSEASKCANCDLAYDTKQEHVVVELPAEIATCYETGLTAGSYCATCGETLVAQEVIPMTDHNMVIAELEIPASCNSVGHKQGAEYCLDCDYDENAEPKLEHSWMHRDAKPATYSAIGWNAHDYCLLCNSKRTPEQYDTSCEFCGENPQGYVEIEKLEIQRNETYEEFLTNLEYLEELAYIYSMDHPTEDPLALVLNYLRTGVANYTSGSWAIMAGAENKEFLKFVQNAEDEINSNPELEGTGVWVNMSGLKKLKSYATPYAEWNPYAEKRVSIMTGHFFGTMDMTYYNKGSQNHADVGGWVGDLTDLLSTSDQFGVPANLTLEEKVEYVRKNYLFNDKQAGSAGAFGSNDLYADLEGFYFMNELVSNGYIPGDLVKMIREYYTPETSLKSRVSYLIDNRLDGLSTRKDLRDAVYNAYTGNKLIATLEGTRNFNASGNELAELRKAVCYAFADEICSIAGDYVEDLTNPRFTVFDSETKILAPGVSQQINYATNADGNQIVYYVATADVSRDDVGVWVNYYDRDPGTPENPEWLNNSVPSSAQNAQDRYGNPESEDYIENFTVIASTNAGGYDMSDKATPGGLMVMNGVEWHPQSGTAGFFAILDDGTAYMGTHNEYDSMMAAGKIKEAIGGFGEFVVKDGKVVGSAAASDAPRTSVGITATGRVVLMCIDGRQAPRSSGASLQDVGYIMKEAGCVVAINLDGGGSTTFVARQPGSDELTIMNKPSDGYPRNVSTNLLIYSTAPSSTAFDHAVIESNYDYATVGSSVQMTAAGVSPSGNAVEIPEGATWAVSNADWASITEDGVFTAKTLGSGSVYLMLDGNIIGTRLMSVTVPDQLYFERNKVDAIYGSAVELPLRARIDHKEIAINANDVNFTISAPSAGTMDGLSFVAAEESNIKTLSITASIAAGSTATINVMLYKQGENSFDFDKATGGDRTLAWDRQVTNSKLEDSNIYNVVDPSKDMVTSYTFAMDMTTIPIPERLEEMTYMLPGGTIEGANAWSFLMSLAQRISDMSWVKATIDFDDRFDVDYSQLSILNDYFEMKDLSFNKDTNSLTVTMNWIKRSQVIDEATANPLCLIKGIKLTPKDGVWEDATKIDAVTSGVISYEIYMRASGLYSFAQKPESQAVFGLYPYRNPNDGNDAGGYFRDTYVEITDEYTLVNVLKEGWVNEFGGFAYYVDGERLTGVQKVDDFYYDFGEDGINVGQTKYTGVFFDEAAKVYRYAYIGVLTSGWQSVNEEWYYFQPSTMAAATGKLTVSHVPYEFEETGKLVSGVWMNVFNGYRYYYGPDYVRKGWFKIGEDMYYFRDAYAVTGDQKVASQGMSTTKLWYHFNESGACEGLLTGFAEENGKLYYIENGKPTEKGLFKYGDYHYNAQYDGSLIVNQKYYVWKLDATAELPKGHYEFDAQGRLLGSGDNEDGSGGVSGIVDKNGKLYYYENGKPTEKGLFKFNGEYYVAQYDGSLIVDQKYYVWKLDATAELPKGHYEFGPDGKMLNGIIDKNGKLYYYENGAPTEKGLFKYEGYYYDAQYDGSLIVNQKYYVWKLDATAELPKGTYEFGPDGKMYNGIVNKSGEWYYYENGVGVEKGLFVYEDGCHYFSQANGKLIVDQKFYAWKLDASALLPKGHYEFAADGKLIGSCITGEIVNKNGVLYYYENGVPTEKGLFKFNGDYYVAQYDGSLIVDQKYYVWKLDVTAELPKGHYEFGADGKMLQGIAEKNGKLYYFENGKATEKGLFKFNGEYYVAQYDGSLIVDQKYYVWKLDATAELPKGHYEFDAEGKMLQGIVDKSGVLYYYENGKATEKGLFVLDGDYYYSQYDGKLIANQKYYVWKIDASANLPKDHYLFDEQGKLIGASASGEIVSVDGVLYYYECGKPVDKGLFVMDGYYYFTLYNGKLVVNQKYYVWKDNDYLMVNHYTFNELGQIVG